MSKANFILVKCIKCRPWKNEMLTTAKLLILHIGNPDTFYKAIKLYWRVSLGIERSIYDKKVIVL